MRQTRGVPGAKRPVYQSPLLVYSSDRRLVHPIPRRSLKARKGKYYGIPDRDMSPSIYSVSSLSSAQAAPTPNVSDVAPPRSLKARKGRYYGIPDRDMSLFVSSVPSVPSSSPAQALSPNVSDAVAPPPLSPAPVLAPDTIHFVRPGIRISGKRMSPMRRFLFGAGQLVISKLCPSRRIARIPLVTPELLPEVRDVSESFTDIKEKVQNELLHGNGSGLTNNDDKLFLDQVQQLDLCHQIRTEFEEGRKIAPSWQKKREGKGI